MSSMESESRLALMVLKDGREVMVRCAPRASRFRELVVAVATFASLALVFVMGKSV